MPRSFSALLLGLVFACVSTIDSLSAAIVTHFDPTLFMADIAGRTTTEIDFDSAVVGTTIADGGVFGGVTFNYTWGSGESIRINDDNDTTSGDNYLGATDGPFTADLQTDFNDITFAPNTAFSAFGLFISSPDAFEGDLILSGSSALSGAASQELREPALQTLGDGSQVFFLGIVTDDISEALDPVTLAGLPGGFLVNYRIDDIIFAEAQVSAVPEPSGLLLIASGSLALTSMRRRRR